MAALGAGEADALPKGDGKRAVPIDSPLLSDVMTSSPPHDSVQDGVHGQYSLDLEKNDSFLPTQMNSNSMENGSFPSHDGYRDTFLHSDQPPLPQQIVTAPFAYIKSLPSKGRRSVFTVALNNWLQVSDADIEQVDQIVDMLHNASLMIDDIQDVSTQRRNFPSTHMIFGAAQTINSAMFHINEATSLALRFGGPSAVQIVIEQLSVLYLGQGYDINNSQSMSCPTFEQYVQTIDGKTGGLFELNARLLLLKSPVNLDYNQIRRLVILLGRYYQLRDDYKNLQLPTENPSRWPTPTAPVCDDLDEGKYTLPLIHLLLTGEDPHLTQNILSTRHITGKMDQGSKLLLLEQMSKSNSMEYAAGVLSTVYNEIARELKLVDQLLGTDNRKMAFLLEMLSCDLPRHDNGHNDGNNESR